jgi:hypothetical protein
MLLGTACATTDEIRESPPVESAFLRGHQKEIAGCVAERLSGKYVTTLTPILRDDPAESIISGTGTAFGGGTTLMQELRFKQVDGDRALVEFRSRGPWKSERSMWNAVLACAQPAT